ncbi:MAG: 23S rRNA (adenine(2503)-C(2))-methyltransferase RlmN [Candidatus Eisenbacteria bacterium]|uniref:23S rRNA (Adenine(2503)-C(2))-methyltransferase RlmN n=1 Tax=Eiseniibacteriota bacterium TaxID=2212470 RepID=A0A948RZ66_UNCEI|nr:23S rRNA (adenine(2503)-C(2))-methyltransferase RlmN [Candidatus Eisenbacteria bacterium]MBU1947303.1 23S rRNA (adenine(2503)-C(2))-methyltransferase RlmN [Candidatus Eisenbacteria bacterium]MBU2691842.1 23S rRNA (adenine(2503)-C(2))-methyltransferase RlmN [Candidatus Eisenbacteria bacterium]
MTRPVVSGSRPIRLLGLTLSEIAGLPELEGQPDYRSGQLGSWLFARGVQRWDDMTDLPRSLRDRLSRSLDISRDPVVLRTEDPNGEAVKFLIQLRDHRSVEAVLIQGRRQTFCVSSQAGCAYGCTFCATAKMGPGRNLTAAEIISQVLQLRDEIRKQGRTDSFNLVFMGMGEPLANLTEVIQSLRILQDPSGFAIGRRRITISTVGLPHEIRKLSQEPVAPRLAFSLSATTPETRRELMPVEKKYSFTEVLNAMREYKKATGQRITLEYVLIKDVNDARDDAARLRRIAEETGAKVNVIAFNAHALTKHETPLPEVMEAFLEVLKPLHSPVTVRHSRGSRIQAACGQLLAETTGFLPGAETPSP